LGEQGHRVGFLKQKAALLARLLYFGDNWKKLSA